MTSTNDDLEKASEEARLIYRATEQHREHLESHACPDCMAGYRTLLNAITEWVKNNKEGENNDEKEIGKKASEAEQEKKRWWDIF